VTEQSSDPSPIQNGLVKITGLVVAIDGLLNLIEAFNTELGWIAMLWFGAIGLLQIPAGLGLMAWKGAAFVVFSILLLVRWLVAFVATIVAFEAGGREAGMPQLITLLVIMAMIAYFGRWSMERRFRPNLDY
jgi:hypothetical protein